MVIKLAIKNIINSIGEFHKVYFLMMLSQMIAVISIFFSYGIFGSYSAKMQDLSIDSYAINAYFTDSNVGILKQCISATFDEIEDKLDYFFVAGAWEEEMISMYSEYHNGSYSLSKTIFENAKVENGRYISNEDIKNSSCVLYSLRGDEDKVDDIISIAGKEFKVIGVDERSPGHYIIPFNACDDNIKVVMITVVFKKLPAQNDYLALKKGLEKSFGENVTVDEFEIKDEEELISVRSIIAISIIIGIISALNTCLLYGYIIKKRRKQMAVYGIIGASKGMCLAINEMEIMIVSFVMETVGFIIYRLGLQGIITSVYENSVNLYGVKSYTIMLLVYILCIFIITFIMLNLINREELAVMMRRSIND